VQVEARVAVQPGDDVRVLVGGPGEIGDSNPGLFTLSGGPSSGLGGTALNGANRIAELRLKRDGSARLSLHAPWVIVAGLG
jgi:hypothetical protein